MAQIRRITGRMVEELSKMLKGLLSKVILKYIRDSSVSIRMSLLSSSMIFTAVFLS